MAMRSAYERLEAKIQPETKRLAERAALIKKMTLTDYLVSLIQSDAPKTLKAYQDLTLANQQFDHFSEICNSKRPLSQEMKRAIDLLDKEGF